jgi:hypothetical protein
MTYRKPNLCVLLVPEGPDRGRVCAAVRRAAVLAGGTPVETPHLTVAYLYDVSPQGRAAYGQSLESHARTVAPKDVIVEGVITWWKRPYEGLLYSVRRTSALESLYDGLAHLARTLDIPCNPPVDMRAEDGTCDPIEPSPGSARSWIPHIKVLETFDGNRAVVAPLLQPLARDLSFRAEALWLSHLDETSQWVLDRRFALDGGVL